MSQYQISFQLKLILENFLPKKTDLENSKIAQARIAFIRLYGGIN
jgi:hypothetical protein